MKDEKYYKELIRNIIYYIKEKANKRKLYSLSVIGSFVDMEQKKIEYINDVDILYIYDDVISSKKEITLDKSIYLSIINLSTEIVKKFSEKDVEISFSCDCGPIKPSLNGNTIQIQIHNIIYTINRWLKEEPTFLLDRTKRYYLLYGKGPDEIYDVNSYSKFAVIRDLFGIDHCMEMITMKYIMYFSWEEIESRPNTLKIVAKKKFLTNTYQDICAFLELLFYSVIRSSINSIRLITREVKSPELECKIFLEKFKGFKLKNFLQEILILKDKYRANQLKPTTSLINNLSRKVLLYLKELKKYLERENLA